jgi:hypothetical protein
MKSPRDYAPVPGDPRPLRRRNQILALMARNGYIPEDLAKRSQAEPIRIRARSAVKTHAPAAIEHVFDELKRHGGARFGVEDLMQGRISVRSTVDERVQTLVNEALETGLALYERRHPRAKGLIQGSVVVLRNADGAILAEAGGRQVYQDRYTRYSDYNLCVIRQRKEPPQASVKGPGARLGRPGKIGPPHGADKEGVPRQDEPRVGPARLVGDHQAEALRRVARRVEDADHDVAADELLPVGQRREREGYIRGLVQAIVGACTGRERAATRPMVRLNVGIDDVRDRGALEGGKVLVALEVIGVRVYDRRRLVAHSPEHVCRAPGLRVEELLENHSFPSMRAGGSTPTSSRLSPRSKNAKTVPAEVRSRL